MTGCDSNKRPYETAINMYNNEQYSEAIMAFDALGDYKDSLAQAEAARIALNKKEYSNAVALFELGKYEDAALVFEKLGDYQDSSDLAEMAKRCVAFNEWFSDLQLISEHGIVQFMTKKQVELASDIYNFQESFQLGNVENFYDIGITVYAGENRVKILKSQVDLNGRAFVSINGNFVVATIAEKSFIVLYLETEDMQPDRIVVELLGGTILEMTL